MNLLRQIVIVSLLNLANLRQRLWQSLVIVVGMACVIGVLLSMLSLTNGMHQAYLNAGDPGRAIVVSAGANSEGGSIIPRALARVILDAPGILKDADGVPVADPGTIVGIPGNRKDGMMAYIFMRGFGPKGVRLRPEFKIVAGRMLGTGKRELVAGVGAQGQFADLAIGDKVIFPDGEWPIVGTFTTGGDVLEGELVGDTDTIMAATRHPNYNSVIVRLTSPGAFDTFRKALTTNPALSVTVERHTDWYRKISAGFSEFFNSVAYTVGAMMAVGALFGCLNTMYSAVSVRAREIATLRALGFGAFPVALSVILEAMVLSVTGALIGAAIAWSLYDGRQDSLGINVFHLSVSPGLIGLGVLWAVAVACLGGLPPAIQAARRPIAAALRAT